MTNWFDASKEGLAALVVDRPKIFIIHELLSNAYDTGCKNIDITLRKVPGKPLVDLFVEDDHPEGFSNLSHSKCRNLGWLILDNNFDGTIAKCNDPCFLQPPMRY